MKKLLLEATDKFELQQLKLKEREALEASLSYLFETNVAPINSHSWTVEAVTEIWQWWLSAGAYNL